MRPSYAAAMTPDDITIRYAEERDLEAINALYNEEVEHGVATFDLEPWTLERRREWLAEHPAEHAPVIVADLDGACVGFACLSVFGSKPGYGYTRENTVFVDPSLQGRGVGRLLMTSLLEEARRVGAHTIIARIEAENAASIALHEAVGYAITGREREVGRKFDRWLDVVEMTITLEGSPSEMT